MNVRLLRFLPLLVLLWLGACRTAGPEKPARTVAEFFSKYESRPGFRATTFEPNFLTRILLGRIGKLSDTEALQALTAVTSIRALTFTPTSAGARNLTERGLLDEVDGLLRNERYDPLPTKETSGGNAAYRYAVRRTGTDRIREVVATGRQTDTPDSFVMLAISGDFTQSQLDQLTKILPGLAGEVTK
ncbi:DUF4252 domain-containing protein [Hymenobacter busanensis]|uniref:DUF4252 domain-containing protein n=1 Tax=Hymenobacter busanensis TaxID=2607656 RepID=A0A7L5A245_9BACT|nr:DUF4252 domain-containing protein [Hymenobacter busanensis]KAA9338397.1 DUF4252 domain-containing protein [Hymenobacter busanensis]QHJ09176.1 DUF4252 domain-containing protein [Hymenobacter busanensis]